MIRKHFLRMNEAVPGGDGGGGTGAPAAGAAAPPAGSGPWFDGLQNPELKGFYQKKGFQDVESLADSYHKLEKTIGAPKERILHLPENMSDAKAMEAIYARLGRPEKPEGYKIEAGEGGEALANWARKEFHGLGLSASQAEGIMQKWGEFAKQQDSEFVTNQETKLKEQQDGLKRKWGAAFEQNSNVAKAAVAKFGVKPEVVAALEKQMGYSDVMEFLYNVGAKVVDPGFVDGTKNANGAMTPLGAQSQINDLKKDTEFQKRLSAGDVAAKEQWNKLHEYAYSSTT